MREINRRKLPDIGNGRNTNFMKSNASITGAFHAICLYSLMCGSAAAYRQELGKRSAPQPGGRKLLIRVCPGFFLGSFR
jgi:hypothetical protein